MVDGKLDNQLFSVINNGNAIEIEIKENEIHVVDSFTASPFELITISKDSELDLLWEILDTILTQISSFDEIELDEDNENWHLFDALLQ